MTWDERAHNVGFGFDRNSNDFKIVNLVHRSGDKIQSYAEIDSAWAFSYIGWSWKRLTCSTPPCFIRPAFPHVFFNGVLHWTATHIGEEYDFILTFDLTHEVFGQILLPETLGTDPCSWNSIVTTGDFLLTIQEKTIADHRRPCVFSLWIMKQYGNHESRTNVYKITTEVIDPARILGARMNLDLILEMEDGQIRRYNPTTSTNVLMGAMENSVFFRFHTESLYLLEKEGDVRPY